MRVDGNTTVPESEASESDPRNTELQDWADELEFGGDDEDADFLWQFFTTAASALFGMSLLVVVLALVLLALAFG